MNLAFSTGRPAHVVLPANLLHQRGIKVTIYTAAYRGRFRDLDPAIDLRWVPQAVPSLHFLTGVQLSRAFQRADTAVYDHLVALRMRTFDIFWGWATGSLAAARAARRLGAHFILDRACPHVDVQQNVLRTECDRLGVAYRPEPAWFHERQLAEYAEADVILVPSNYSADSFLPELRSKVIVAPLFGRLPSIRPAPAIPADRPFTFGTVGGQPLRKGFLYLLQAWERLKLPHARLLMRTDADLKRFPALRELMRRLPNVELVGYQRNMNDFYSRCDAFVFPTVDDGFGMALLEALAHGLPAITTTHCGSSELFTHGTGMLVVPAQDAEALARAMEMLYRSPETREQLRTNASLALQAIETAGSYELYSKALDKILQRLGLPQR